MPISVTSVSLASIKKAMWEASTPVIIGLIYTDGTGAYNDIFNSDVDLTDIDELTLVSTTTGNSTLRCSIGAVVKATQSGASGHTDLIDTSAITGITNIKLEAKDLGATSNVQDITLWASVGS